MKPRARNITTSHRMKLVRLLLLVLCGLLLAATAGAQGAKQSQTESRYASLDGARIRYQSYGKGREALVLIHGWTCNLDNWQEVIPNLSKRSRAIAIELPGHGQSDKPQIAYTMDQLARAVDSVL